MDKKKVIKACRQIIDKHNDNTTLYELLESEKVDGLTFYEAELVSTALDNYYSGATARWASGDGTSVNDVTPYDIVKALKLMDDANRDNNTLYYQVTACDRWGYEMGSDSNADYFDNILNLISQGNVLDAFLIANENGTSGFPPCSYEKIVKGLANNDGERIVYDDFNHIMTVSQTSYTIYRKMTRYELNEWLKEN